MSDIVLQVGSPWSAAVGATARRSYRSPHAIPPRPARSGPPQAAPSRATVHGGGRNRTGTIYIVNIGVKCSRPYRYHHPYHLRSRTFADFYGGLTLMLACDASSPFTTASSSACSLGESCATVECTPTAALMLTSSSDGSSAAATRSTSSAATAAANERASRRRLHRSAQAGRSHRGTVQDSGCRIRRAAGARLPISGRLARRFRRQPARRPPNGVG